MILNKTLSKHSVQFKPLRTVRHLYKCDLLGWGGKVSLYKDVQYVQSL